MKRKIHDWSDAMIERLKQLHADTTIGFSGMAKLMSDEFQMRLSKNACIGKARRVGLPARAVGRIGPAKPRSRARRRPAAPVPAPAPRIPTAWTVEPPVLPVASGRITIYQLTSGRCHYPFGSRPPYAYCGNTTSRGSSWCPHHERVVYPRGTGR